MSTALEPVRAARPPGRVTGRATALLTILLMLISGLFFGAVHAQAPSLDVGYGNEDLWLGSFSSHGRQAYCMGLDALPPYGSTQHPELQTTLDSLASTEPARLNYVMGRRGELANPSVSMSISMSDQYHGQLAITANPVTASGTVTLTNATFANGSTTAAIGAGTHQIVGTPPEAAPTTRSPRRSRLPPSAMYPILNPSRTPAEVTRNERSPDEKWLLIRAFLSG